LTKTVKFHKHAQSKLNDVCKKSFQLKFQREWQRTSYISR